MRMFLGGQWQDRSSRIDVTNPYDGAVIDTVPKATAADVDSALATLVEGAKIMRNMPAYDRSAILRRAAGLMLAREQDLGRTISAEEGKILAEGLFEASRARETIDVSADEARRITSEVVPLDAAPGGKGKFGFTLRVPCGIVAAITPFNFPLNLVAHKVGPAIAAGNAVVIKPASDTPLSALKLVEILLEAGLPPEAIACVTGGGGEIGNVLCTDRRVRKISFTGSYEIGDAICRMAGVKRVTMELGSNSPVIVLDDADLEKAANLVAVSGFSNAGQVCISAQRILVTTGVYGDFLDALKPRVASAVGAGAKLVTGGQRRGTIYEPTILADVSSAMRISCDELFGPAVAVTCVDGIDEAIRLANSTNYGLSASIFTRDIDRALKFAREVDSGNLHINWGTQWRADLMPYGGLKDSGLGKEGPHYAIREMTEEKMVVIHG
ncbi:MAG: aldehyde dehydrogenase family protein [Planctomycetota bacterium]|nr:aldehyde dehydrogenase family protein [Planctomycetota bacterium]